MTRENILRVTVCLIMLLLCWSVSAQNVMEPASPQEAEAMRRGSGASPDRPLMGASMVDPRHTGFYQVAGQRRGYGISYLYVSKFSRGKIEQKQNISSSYITTMSLAPAAHGCNLIIQLESKDRNHVIEGNNGAVFLLIPEELNPAGSFTLVEFLDDAGQPIDSASFPNFENMLLGLLKNIADRIPGQVGSRADKVAKKIGVGDLEEVDIEGTILDSDSGYKAHTKSWDTKYHDGRWVRGSILQIIVPLMARVDIAESAINRKGVGVFLYAQLTGSSSSVGILLDNMRRPSISNQQSDYKPQIEPEDMLIVDSRHRGTYMSAGINRRYGSSFIYVPRLWVNKEPKRKALSGNFNATISLVASGAACKLVIQLKAANTSSFIEGNNGGIFVYLPGGLYPVYDQAQVQFLDSSGNPLTGASLPGFEDILLEILKNLSPGEVATVTEDVFRRVGVGMLEPVGAEHTIFDSATGYIPLARSWDDIRSGRQWIRAGILQFSVPLGVGINAAESLINQRGVGAFIYAKLSGASANVGVMLDNMRKPLIEGYTPQTVVVATDTSSIFVVDVSASMDEKWQGQTKLEAARIAVQQVLDLIQMEAAGTSRHQAGLVSFSNTAEVEAPLTYDWAELRNKVKSLGTVNMTNLGAGLVEAMSALQGTQGEKLIILLSDGITNRGLSKDEIISGPVQEAAASKIKVYTVGMGNPADLDEELLKQIADATGGVYYHAIDPQQLQQVYRAVQHQARGGDILADYVGKVAQGETTTGKPLVVPVGVLELYVSLSWPGSELDIVLIDPRGNRVDSKYPGARLQHIGSQKSLLVSNPMAGTWRSSVYGKDIPQGSTYYQVLASVKRSQATSKAGGVAPLPRQITKVEIFLKLFSALGVVLMIAIIILLIRRRGSQERE